ncbi:MAG TPA: MFS transporter [Roseiflexaceae bacterium]|nr:MFS transporter [Roseiflexaceae bacterium]
MLQTFGGRVERALVGRLPADVAFNVRIELLASVAYGAFFAACLGFLPVVLRRLGATTDQLALYVMFNYLGLIFSPLSMTALRWVTPMRMAAVCWGVGRGLFLLGFAVTGAGWMLALTAVFWVMESLPSPAYSRIMQQGYPRQYRGRAMAGIRVGMALTVLLLTPLAGLLLDLVGYQVLFPIAGFFGILSVVIFRRMDLRDVPEEPQAQPSVNELLPILLRNRSLLFYLLALTVYGFGAVMPVALYPVVQVSRLGLSYTEIGGLGLVQSLFWLIGFFFWGRVLDQRGPLWVLQVSVVCAIIVPFTYIWADSAWMLVPAFIAQGLLQGGFELGVTNTTIALAERGRVIEYAALQTATIGLRGMLAPFVGTLLLGMGVSETTLFAVAAAMVASSLVFFARVRMPK